MSTTTLDHVIAYTLPAAYALLPPALESDKATALVLAIGVQESKFAHRRQIGGPARSFWQFEPGDTAGFRGVLRHPKTRPLILEAMRVLRYPPDIDPAVLFVALEHSDTLAACFARCLLWTLPAALPGPADSATAWGQYLEAWRPGKPRPDDWPAAYAIGWATALRAREAGLVVDREADEDTKDIIE